MADKPATKPEPGELVPSPTGRGFIRYGSQPGGPGGPGRPPALFRQAIRELLYDRKLVDRLADIAEGRIGEIHEERDADGNVVKVYTATPIREQRGAIEALLKYGLGPDKGLPYEEIRRRLGETVDAINELVPEHLVGPVLARISAIWRDA